jgi:hypothetical protein
VKVQFPDINNGSDKKDATPKLKPKKKKSENSPVAEQAHVQINLESLLFIEEKLWNIVEGIQEGEDISE